MSNGRDNKMVKKVMETQVVSVIMGIMVMIAEIVIFVFNGSNDKKGLKCENNWKKGPMQRPGLLSKDLALLFQTLTEASRGESTQIFEI